MVYGVGCGTGEDGTGEDGTGEDGTGEDGTGEVGTGKDCMAEDGNVVLLRMVRWYWRGWYC